MNNNLSFDAYPMRLRFSAACLLAASMLMLTPAPASCAPAAGTRTVVTLAEQPLRLIRGVTVYRAPAGVALQKDDILETGATGAQVEAGSNAILALGPRTRALVALDGAAGPQVVLLQGWAKLLDKTGKPALVATPALQVMLPAGSTVVHGADGRDEVFAEEGEQSAVRVDAKGAAGLRLKLPAEGYAAVDAAKPQLVAGRPPKPFIAALPPGFRDGLANAPAMANAGKVAPVKEREADFADVEAWLAAPLPNRKALVARFKPRLADPAFRAQLDRALGQSAEWKPVLHPPAGARGRRLDVLNRITQSQSQPRRMS